MSEQQNIVETGNESTNQPYAARLEIDYPEKLDRLSSFFRLFMIILIGIILGLITGEGQTITNTVVLNKAGEIINRTCETAGGMASGFAIALMLMIFFQQRYPRWWFDFLRELTRFSTRVRAYAGLLTDTYPSTEDEQAVHLEIDLPNVEQDLKRWLPLVKWFLAIPHIIVLVFLSLGSFFAVIIAWFAILFSGQYPKSLFDYNVGVYRWWLRVYAYAFLMVTDVYPPFSLS